MATNSLSHFLPQILVALFAVAAIVDLVGARYIRAHFRRWRHPRRFYRVMGVLQLITALFLWVPELRIWGLSLGGLTLFFWVVTLLNHRQWGWAVIGMLMLVVLPVSLIIH